jgi:hypothetical protein
MLIARLALAKVVEIERRYNVSYMTNGVSYMTNGVSYMTNGLEGVSPRWSRGPARCQDKVVASIDRLTDRRRGQHAVSPRRASDILSI